MLIRWRGFVTGLIALALAGCGSSNRSDSSASGMRLIETSEFPRSWGKTYSASLASVSLGRARKLHIFLPESYDRTKRKYPLVLLTDGEHNFERACLAAKQLASAGHIPECIVVGIETPERRQDLTPPGMSHAQSDGPDQRGEKFLKFVCDELKPQLAKTFRIIGPSVFMGHSHGGILAVYAAANWRKELPFIVALDSPVNIDNHWLENRLVLSAKGDDPLRLVSLEVRFGWTDDSWLRLTSKAPRTWRLSRMKLEGEDHESMVFDGFYQGLKKLFSDYNAVQVKDLGGAEALENYQKLNALYGAEVTPPQFVLERAARDMAFFGKTELVRSIVRDWEDGYGEAPGGKEFVTQAQEAEKALKGKETLEQLLNWPPPSQQEIAPYVGIWRGEHWMSVDDNRRTPFAVTFSVERGRGVAVIEEVEAPKEFRIRRAQYLRVTKEGIEFGLLNGMTPRGILVRMGKLNGDRMEGEEIFKGVYVKDDPSDPRPKFFFALTKTK